MFQSQFQNTEFAYPWVLALLLIIPLLVWWYIRNNTANSAAITISTTRNFDSKKSLKVKLYNILFVFRCLAIASIIIVIARPQKRSSIQYIEGEGIDIMLCIDVSSSMEALDFEPNRMEASKQMAQDFIKNRFGDRIGVVAFSSKCYTLCPLTTDTNAVLNQLNTIKIGAFPAEDASLVNSSIASCITKLKSSKVRSKIIILISDGVVKNDIVSEEIIIELSKKYNIKIYTIGVGTTNNVPINVTTIKDGIKRFESIQNKVFGYNETLLKELAEKTGGKYFYATDKEALANVYNDINRLEKSDIQIVTHNNFVNKYLPFVIIGFLFLFIEMILKYTLFRRFP